MVKCEGWCISAFFTTLSLCLVITATEFTADPGDDIDALVRGLSPGDILTLNAGTYSGDDIDIDGVNGSSPAWITIRGAPGQTVVVTCGYGLNAVNLDSSSYIRLENLEIKTSGDGIKFNSSCDHIVIRDCYIHDIAGVGINSQGSNVSYVEVTECETAYCGSCGLYLGKSDGSGIVHHWTITGCYIHHCGGSTTGYGLQVKPYGYANVVQDCVFHHVAGSSRAGIAFYYTDRGDSDDNIARRNVVWNVPRNDNSTDTAALWACADAVFENNIVFDAGRGFHCNEWGGHAIRDLKVNNNTFYNCSEEGLFTAAAVNSEAFNNAVYLCGQNTAPGWTTGCNLVSNDASGVFQSTSFGSQSFLYPAGGGDLVDAGDDAHAPADDFNRSSRPYGSFTDVGAYEYEGGTNPGWLIQNAPKDIPDTTPPFVSLMQIDITGTASDTNGVAVWVDGVEYPVGGGVFSTGWIDAAGGQTFTVRAADSSDNERTISLKVQ